MLLLMAIIIVPSIVSCGGDDDITNDKKEEQNNNHDGNDDITVYRSCPNRNHPHTIDLGLSSGTKWACCNVGASEPEDMGKYYAWGEIYTKNLYNYDTYKHGRSIDDVDFIGSDIAGTPYDAATANWGEAWCIPSQFQMQELFDNCSTEWTTINGVKGWKVTGKNNGTIFFPAAGSCYDGLFESIGQQGFYWTSSLADNLWSAYSLQFYSQRFIIAGMIREAGLSIRPIRK